MVLLGNLLRLVDVLDELRVDVSTEFYPLPVCVCPRLINSQLLPSFNFAQKNAQFAHNNHFGAPNRYYYASVPPIEKQRTSSRPPLLPAVTPLKVPFQPQYWPLSHQQLLYDLVLWSHGTSS
jgi:hypothetical protein